VIDDSIDAKKVTRVAFCSGKIYYDLIERREKEGVNDIAFVRIEQLYPFPQKQIDAILKKYSSVKEFIFAQEEPENMGPWRFIDHNMRSLNLRYVGRPAAASPATGFAKRHAAENEDIMTNIFKKVLVK
jgi:2-oxoglutarate dehydrogenase E1 component